MAGFRTLNRLKALVVERQRTPGVFPDGGGLSLIVTHAGTKRWELRTIADGRRRQLGLGVYPGVSLDDARRRAEVIRDAARKGAPISRRGQPGSTTKPVTFRGAFENYFEMKSQQLSNKKHRLQWRATMETYVFPTIGACPVGEVTSVQIIDILKPIWNVKPETAKRVLQRMRAVFECAIVRGDREKASPTVGIVAALGTRSFKTAHYAALPYAELPGFMAQLRSLGSSSSILALAFLVLTASRSGEVRGATWEEIEFDTAVWTISETRMKARTTHRVPLSLESLAILKTVRAIHPDSDFIFPGVKPGSMLSDMTLTKVLRRAGFHGNATVHGFRSSFKDWCAEIAGVRDEVSEAALAHKIPEKVRRAYLRTDFLEQRKALMQMWGTYCSARLQNAATVVFHDAPHPSTIE